jgi:hypothetical protein
LKTPEFDLAKAVPLHGNHQSVENENLTDITLDSFEQIQGMSRVARVPYLIVSQISQKLFLL